MNSRKPEKLQVLPDGESSKAKPESPWDDLDKLTAPQNFEEMAGVRKALLTVPVRKPNDQTFFRIHPSPEYRRDFWCVEVKDDREVYVVHPEFVQEVALNQLTRRTFYLGITRQGSVFLWPIKLPSPELRKNNEWAPSAREIAEIATGKWTRMWANMGLGAYECCTAEGITIEPEWPNLSLSEILKIAFKGKGLIESHDHPVMKLLRGES